MKGRDSGHVVRCTPTCFQAAFRGRIGPGEEWTVLLGSGFKI